MTFGPAILDVILAIIVIEFLIIVIWLRAQNALRLVPACACFLLSGGLLVIALRFGLEGPIESPVVLGALALSFPVHVATLWLIWRQIQ